MASSVWEKSCDSCNKSPVTASLGEEKLSDECAHTGAIDLGRSASSFTAGVDKIMARGPNLAL